ncbi:Ankyrin-repeat containing protein. Substrate of the Dot/Icm secretion system (plasmid) [Legionella adelaidensis]|uniref:Ankyrin-repeat containing protein, substrate of the Dot/Icm secretion system n=1 Tax=Legionella adelaidensis TaxID=45056 RepID=A0A0W0R1U8_9GAMM|nr:Dot/Icm T4SS effector AnkY/LegA9 [Legionella adelaidensis]KTC65005.1 Ankyrin-repeat containing protein, substrate of the Dot/Icm secretion system [Legionella adelaidensis]VEH85315.1 Ankyrin-repeat containing protein. Substrate of the Dot/Icm secretion system [Legionella adelaidensis]
MGQVILIHANCHNETAKGDYAFAGSLARDMMQEIRLEGKTDVDIVLISSLSGVRNFEFLYGAPIDGRLSVDGFSIGLSSLETLDPLENTVVAFIDANRCKYAPSELVKRVISPECKFLFVGNAHQPAYGSYLEKLAYNRQVAYDQPGLYDLFNSDDFLVASAGFGADRLGLPFIQSAGELKLSREGDEVIPKRVYGFMYLAAVQGQKDYQLITQYIKLTGLQEYLLVGNFASNASEIQKEYESDATLDTSLAYPKITFHQSLPHGTMRQAVARSAPVVLATGVASTIEALKDGKLTYYQDFTHNAEFVASFLVAIKSLISTDSGLFGAMPQMLTDLATLLFADKPLSKKDMHKTHELLNISTISSRLIEMNQKVIDKASGKIAPRLLGFINAQRSTTAQEQLASVCYSLRKPTEVLCPVYDQALRRAAAWGKLLELKTLVKYMKTDDLNKIDPASQRSALHWATISRNFDCAAILVRAHCALDLKDKDGKTPLHYAVAVGDRNLIQLYVRAGASVDIYDNTNLTPGECTSDSDVKAFLTSKGTESRIGGG